MKIKLFYMLPVLFLLACGNETPQDRETELRSVINMISDDYKIIRQYLDFPLDLNFDGIANTDLSKEYTYYEIHYNVD